MIDSYLLYKDKLKGEYSETFKQVEFYCETIGMDRCLIEERLNELMDVFISAQEAERPIETIVGKDINEFCKSFCSDISFKTRATNFFDRCKNMIWYIFVFAILDLIIGIPLLTQSEPPSIWRTDGLVTDSFIIWAAIITACSAICNAAIVWIMDIFNIVPTKTKRVVYWVVSFVLVLAVCYLVIDDTVSFMLPIGYVLSFCVAYLVVYYSINRKRLAKRKANKVSFWDTVEVPLDTKRLVKAFNKKNRRLERKGKPLLTREEFLAKNEKQIENSARNKIMFILIPLVMTAAALFSMDFETVLDMIICGVIMLTVEGFMMYFLYKCSEKSINNGREEIELLRQNPDLWEE